MAKRAAKTAAKTVTKGRAQAKRTSPTKTKKAAPKRTSAAAPKRAASRTSSNAAEQWRADAMEGWITHTEIATTDPEATKAWAKKVLGWKFGEPFMMAPGQPYHMFHYAEAGGGGIMALQPGEAPRVTPYVTVASVTKSIEKALKAGAKHVMGPETVMPGVVIALVEAPGGVQIGFSGTH